MEIHLAQNHDTGKVMAYFHLVMDKELVIRECRLIRGERPFLAMPSRKRFDHCPNCTEKNALDADYCNGCGKPLPEVGDMTKLHADVVFPLHTSFRAYIEKTILDVYNLEASRAKHAKSSPPEKWLRYDLADGAINYMGAVSYG